MIALVTIITNRNMVIYVLLHLSFNKKNLLIADSEILFFKCIYQQLLHTTICLFCLKKYLIHVIRFLMTFNEKSKLVHVRRKK